jgi:hypothetical protein
MANKTHRQRNKTLSAYEQQCKEAGEARKIRGLSKLGLISMLLTLLNPFFSLYQPTAAFAAPLVPTANTWTNYTGAIAANPYPNAVERFVMVADPISNTIIVHGGLDGNAQAISDTWELDLTAGTWTKVNVISPTSDIPLTRPAACAVWDDVHNQMLVYGGQDSLSNGTLDKVWRFDPRGNNGTGIWKQMDVANPGTDPEPDHNREGVSCAWDSSAHQMLVYGGGPGEEVWAFNPSAANIGVWTEVAPRLTPFNCGRTTGATPGSRSYSTAIWNPQTQRMLIWGGRDTCNLSAANTLNDVWSFNPGNYTTNSGSWTKLNVTGGPVSARDQAAAVWDPTINQMVIFGGAVEATNTYFADVWNFKQTSDTAGQWSKRTPLPLPSTPGTNAPAARGYFGGVYIPAIPSAAITDPQIIYFGGRANNNGPLLNDVWGLGKAPLFGLKFSATITGFVAGGKSNGVQVQLTSIDGITPVANTLGTPVTVTVRVTPAPNANCGFNLDGVGTCGTGGGGTYNTTVDLHIAPGNTTSTETFYYSDTLAGSRTLIGEAPALTSLSAVQAVAVTPAEPAALAFTRQPPATAIQNVAFASTQQPIVAFKDVYSNTVTTAATTPITLSLKLQNGNPLPNGAIISGTTTVSTTNGVSAYSGLAITKGNPTPYQLVASATYSGTVLPNAFSTAIQVNCVANTTIVTTLADPFPFPADNCQVSLRQAITIANAAPAGSITKTVTFAPNLLPSSVISPLQIITLTAATSPTNAVGALPTLGTEVKIDAGCDVAGNRGRPRIAIDGSLVVAPDAGQTAIAGFTLSNGTTITNGNTINGLAIYGFNGYGINIDGSTGNTITCNYIGTYDGTSAKPNLLGGIYIKGNQTQYASAVVNNIGLTGSATSGNLITGAGGNQATSKPAVQADGRGAKNYLYHNFINYNASGTAALSGAQSSTVTPVKATNRARLITKQGNKIRR